MKQSLAQKLTESMKMFLIFFKIGLFSFGGGYAMLAMIEHEVVEKKGWLTHGELLDIFAIAESTPGAISINIATFIGTKRAGVIGGIVTTLGVVLPAFLVILALSYVLNLVRDNKWVNALFTGVRVGVVVLIIHAALKFLREMKKKVVTVLLAVAMFCLAAFADINVIYLMLGSIGISVVAVAVAHVWARRKFLINVSTGTPHYVRERGGVCPESLLACNLLPEEEPLPETEGYVREQKETPFPEREEDETKESPSAAGEDDGEQETPKDLNGGGERDA